MKSPLKLFVFTLAVLLSSCYSHKSAVASGAHNAQLIQWPEGYAPETADFYVYNEIDIAASPEIVWDILIQAESWGQWYPHAKNGFTCPSKLVVGSKRTGRSAVELQFQGKLRL